MTTFTPAGSISGIPLVSHQCPEFGVAYISEAPFTTEDGSPVPICGCQPDSSEEGPS
jgi:hypothetical protein